MSFLLPKHSTNSMARSLIDVLDQLLYHLIVYILHLLIWHAQKYHKMEQILQKKHDKKIELFEQSIRSEHTKKVYTVCLNKYLEFAGSNKKKHATDPKKIEQHVIDFNISKETR